MAANVVVDNNDVNGNTPVACAPSMSRPYHHGNLRTALLEGAERTLRERGAQELSLRELARDVGVSHAAPRRHFADKQALLDALAEEGFDRLGRELRQAMVAAGDDFDARLAAFARAYVRFATRDAALLELMFAGKGRPDAADSLRAAADGAFAAPLALIAEGQAAGVVVPGDTERVAKVAWASLQGLASMTNAGMLDEEELDEVVPAAVDRMINGLRPR
jgi:AcrR family transcriptional regulator